MITILLDQNAIEEALTNYIGETTLGVDLSQKEISIKLIAGRGGNGLRAEVSISDSARNVEDEDDEDELPDLGDELAPESETDVPAVGPFD
jgi:hypothetical protein